MPSRRSPSQRTPEGRQGRQAAALIGGSNAGRMISASRRTAVTPTPNAPSGGDSDHPGTGTDSTQVGQSAEASADRSTALGVGAIANAEQATALGRDAEATAYGGTAVGEGTFVDSSEGTALGRAAEARADESTALGADSETDGQRSVAVGYGSFARSDAPSAVAVGAEATCLAEKTVAIGDTARATHARCVAIGYGSACGADDEGVIQVDAFEVVPSSGGLEAWVVLPDSTGVRWKISVDTSGALVVTAA